MQGGESPMKKKLKLSNENSDNKINEQISSILSDYAWLDESSNELTSQRKRKTNNKLSSTENTTTNKANLQVSGLESAYAWMDESSNELNSPKKRKLTKTVKVSKKAVNSTNTKLPSFLFSVESIRPSIEESLLELTLTRVEYIENNLQKTKCILQDSWSNVNVRENDIVHVLTEPTLEKDGSETYVITDAKGYIIMNPHFILSGTNILSSMFCMRKSTLNWKFKDTDVNSTHMILGSLLHVLFQTAVTTHTCNTEGLKKLLVELLQRRQIIGQLYEANVNEEHVLRETQVYLDSIEKWLRENVTMSTQTKSATLAGKNFQISDICDIEESIWSPTYGVKGKLDLTLRTNIRMSAYKNLSSGSSLSNNFKKENKPVPNGVTSHVIPVELKSGKTTFSVEHEGQVMLYSLLNYEKRRADDFGLLLYLKDMSMKFIKVTQVSLRGLIQLRNEVTYYIAINQLPEFKDEERICGKCPLLIPCSLLGARRIGHNEEENKVQNDLPPIYSNAIAHLSVSESEYFNRWYTMLEFEFQEAKQFESGNLIWWKSLSEMEATGWTVGHLHLTAPSSKAEGSSFEYTGEGWYLFEFKRDENQSQLVINLKENDMILLTSQTDNLVGIAQGFIRSISNNNNNFTLLIDKNLSQSNYRTSFADKNHLFRIDKINYRSAINLNYTNLARLMNANERSRSLRAFVVNKKEPSFDKVFNKQYILQNKAIFKKLNESQRTAIIKTLMAHNYLLIKGYPGTGKTTTIAALIAILVNLGKRVLFTSFTNSAVDNLLLKILHDYTLDFIRIGSYERIHPDIQRFESNSLTAHIKSVDDLDEFYKSKQLVATTCSSINNVAFSKIQFDYCITDEASQVLLTTCLGPLFICKKFVLVGDLEQLPPIIKNKDARAMGMGVSLFEWLDSEKSSVELVHQYRMNREIMSLANRMTYNDKLECISDKVAQSSVKIEQDFLESIKCEHIKSIFTKSVVFVDTSELLKSTSENEQTENEVNRTVNKTECEIVRILCEAFKKHSDCQSAEKIGIIAPYNNQVNALQAQFSSRLFFKDIEVNTVDQFQGRDKNMIIMSFTNSVFKNEEIKEFEILNDKRRLTVAISRAKQKLIMLGSVNNLVRYKPLASLISILKEDNAIVTLSCLEQFKSKLFE